MLERVENLHHERALQRGTFLIEKRAWLSLSSNATTDTVQHCTLLHTCYLDHHQDKLKQARQKRVEIDTTNTALVVPLWFCGSFLFSTFDNRHDTVQYTTRDNDAILQSCSSSAGRLARPGSTCYYNEERD